MIRGEIACPERIEMSAEQQNLFGSDLPDGFDYRPEILSPGEEQALAARIAALDLRPFEFQGFLGKRRIASFGWRYRFDGTGLEAADPIPSFLLPARERAADLLGRPAEGLVQVLVTEYEPGATIGWHRDRPVFGDVAGLSLLAPARFRLRRKQGNGWERRSLELAPRSGYAITGEARDGWEHSIPAVDALRYSITFRTLR
jgi:alkylated DNA repair dioxygenase AlkB